MQLTRNRIIGAAVEMIERDGLEVISMPGLATELGCGVMALYSHVPSKAALLDGLAEALTSRIEFTPMPGASWEDQVRAQARAFRQIARTHPRCSMIVASQPATSTTALRPVEHALATLRDAGFGGEDAIAIMRTFVAYILGSLLREVGVAPGLAGPDRGGPARAGPRPRLRVTDFPQMTSLAAELGRADPDADFEFGLDLLVRAAAALLPARAAAR
jgi:AcrR family transcriptional regulator